MKKIVLILCLVGLCLKSFSQTKLRADTIQARKFYQQGLLFDSQGNYDSATYFLKKASVIYKKYKLHKLTIDVQNKWAFDLCLLGDLENASMLLDENLVLCKKYVKPVSLSYADTYHTYGVAYYVAGYYREAISYSKKALEIRRKILGNIHQKTAGSVNNLGILYETLEEYDSSKIFYDEYLAISLQLHGPKSRDVANAYNNLGSNAYYNSNYKAGVEMFQKAIETYKESIGPDHPEIASSYLNLGNCYTELGEYQKSLDFTFFAGKILRDNYGEESPQYLNVLMSIGTIYSRQGETRLALENSLKGYEIAERVFGPEYPALGKFALNIGTIYFDLKDYQKSVEWQQRSLEQNIKIQGDTSYEVASNYNNLSNAHFKLKHYDEAEKFILKSIGIKKKRLGIHHESLAFSYMNLGNIYFEKNDFLKSLQANHMGLIANHFTFADTSVTRVPPLSDYSSLRTFAYLLIHKATCYYWLYTEQPKPEMLYAALANLKIADSLYLRNQLEMENERDLITLSSDLKEMAVTGFPICIELYKLTKDKKYQDLVFYFKERSKGTALRLAIAHAQAGRSAGISGEKRNEQQALQHKLAENKLALAQLLEAGGQESDPDVSERRAALFHLGQQYESFVKSLQQENPRYYELKYSNKIVSSKQIQEYLRKNPETALVQYSLFDSTLNILALTRDDVMTYDTTASYNIEKNVRGLRNSIIFQSNDQLVALSKKLYRTIWEPVEKFLSASKVRINHVVIIQDGILSYLPYEVLISPGYNGTDFRKTPFLLKKYQLSYAVSATQWLDHVMATPKYGEREFIAFAPVFSDESETNFLVNTTERSIFKSDTTTRSLLRGGKIEAIPHSKDEVINIQKLYTKRNLFAKYFIFKNAKETAIKDPELSHYRYIHLATHGVVNDDFPELSALLLAQDSTGGEDGVLYSGEIYNLEWNADLITLSACETGLGKIAQGEGILGLTRGFIYAGAKNLLVSLWRVSDASTSQLMIAFYNSLLSNNTKALSLQKAKLELVKSKTFNHPYYWAPFVLIGN